MTQALILTYLIIGLFTFTEYVLGPETEEQWYEHVKGKSCLERYVLYLSCLLLTMLVWPCLLMEEMEP